MSTSTDPYFFKLILTKNFAKFLNILSNFQCTRGRLQTIHGPLRILKFPNEIIIVVASSHMVLTKHCAKKTLLKVCW